MVYPVSPTQFPPTFPGKWKRPITYSNPPNWVLLAIPGNPAKPPEREVPYPDQEEIMPNPDLPEEEEYLPDEEEIDDDPLWEEEMEEPYQPRREEQSPPEEEREFPGTEPAR